MTESVKAVIRALNDAGVRYLVVGGVAVVLHGYSRMTRDLDLVLRLERENVLDALEALASLGYRPTIPVDLRDFADPEVRRRWANERNLTVFSLTSDRHRHLIVDLFASEPFDFERAWEDVVSGDLGEGVIIPLVSIETLIRMKEDVGRTNDLDDVAHLRRIREMGTGTAGTEADG